MVPNADILVNPSFFQNFIQIPVMCNQNQLIDSKNPKFNYQTNWFFFSNIIPLIDWKQSLLFTKGPWFLFVLLLVFFQSQLKFSSISCTMTKGFFYISNCHLKAARRYSWRVRLCTKTSESWEYWLFYVLRIEKACQTPPPRSRDPELSLVVPLLQL